MCKYCSIVPHDVLVRLSRDNSLSASLRRDFKRTAAFDVQVRKLREQARKLTRVGQSIIPAGLAAQLPGPAEVLVFDCHQTQTLPGAPIENPGRSGDPTAKAAFTETTALLQFYSQVFKRNSIDNAGMTLMSSVHYGINYNNAFWNGTQMAYGDGDGQIFVDFTRGNDVIGHENTHGVTQYTLQLTYANEPGGLNESLSDVFGSMFRQWQASQTVDQADWLIGKDIMGPEAIQRGYSCLRDMADPAAEHCLAPQPKHYSQYQPGMDPHSSSGIPNFAFYTAAMSIGGKSWEKAGKIWYNAMTGYGASPNLLMSAFADRTREVAAQLYAGDTAVIDAVDQGWKKVGL